MTNTSTRKRDEKGSRVSESKYWMEIEDIDERFELSEENVSSTESII